MVVDAVISCVCIHERSLARECVGLLSRLSRARVVVSLSCYSDIVHAMLGAQSTSRCVLYVRCVRVRVCLCE